MLHVEGELYMLSCAFHTTLEGYGGVKPELYVGLDNRPLINIKDTLADVVAHEPISSTYKRIPVRTDGGFYLLMIDPNQESDDFGAEMPMVPAMRAAVEHIAQGADIGRVNNVFLTTAAEGSNGLLIMSNPLEHPLDFWENVRLTTESTIGLRKMRFNRK